MIVYMFNCEPAAEVKQSIIETYKPVPAPRAETRVWWSNDENDYTDYLVVGEFDFGSSIMGISNAYKIWFGSSITRFKSIFEPTMTTASLIVYDNIETIDNGAFTGLQLSIQSVTILANGGNAENVKQMMIAAGIPSGITWNMPS